MGNRGKNLFIGFCCLLVNGFFVEVCVFWNGSGVGLGIEIGSFKIGNERCGVLLDCIYI